MANLVWNRTRLPLCAASLIWLVGLPMARSQSYEAGTSTAKEEAGSASANAENVRQGYLYIEPYQTRFEVLFDVPLALKWLKLEGLAFSPLDESARKRITDRARMLAADWAELHAGSSLVKGRLIDALIVKGRPGATLPLVDSEALSPDEAMLGFVWEFPTPPAPEFVSLQWKGFIPGADDLPVTVHFGPKTEKMFLTRSVPMGQWNNNGRLPRPERLAPVPTFPSTEPTRVPLGFILSVVGGLIFYTWIKLKDYRLPGGASAHFFVWILGTAMMSMMLVVEVGGGSSTPKIESPEDAQAILEPLLRNTYRAFDHRAESDIYDVLARSVDGELLRELYLETIRALTLEGREGTRTQVTDFEARVEKVSPNPDGPGFLADCEWTALGTISHWGHPHTRVNRYTAKVLVEPVGGEWKISAIEVTEARRI